MKLSKIMFIAGMMSCAFVASSFFHQTNVNAINYEPAKKNRIHDVRKAVGGEKLVLEAENAIVTGTPHVAGEDFVEIGKTSNNPNHPTSNNGSIGYWATQGNKLTFTVNASKNVEGVALDWWFAAGDTSAKTLSDNLKVTVNDTSIAWKDNDKVIARSGNDWANWQNYEMGETASFKSGKNYIVLENLQGINIGIDCLTLTLPAGDVAVTESLPDTQAPTITNFRTSETAVINKEVEILFDLTDNECPIENITVEIKCVYGFGTDDASNVELNGTKFTPTKEGKYTFFITAKDDAGNQTKQVKFVVNVVASTNVFIWKDSDTAWVIFGVTVGLSLAMIGCMIYINIKKKVF